MALTVEINKPCFCLSSYTSYCSIWSIFSWFHQVRQYLNSLYIRCPVLTIILSYNRLADQLQFIVFGKYRFFWNVNVVVVKSNILLLAATLLLPINLCTVDLSISWVGQYLFMGMLYLEWFL